MSERNIWICHTCTGAKWLKPVSRRTQKGADDYANRMGFRYGEKCTVRVEEYDYRTCALVHRCDWSA